MSQNQNDPGNPPLPAEAPVQATPASASFKDRIADLRVGQRAGALGSRLADRMKAVQAAAPAAVDLKGKVKAAAGAVRLDKLNRETLKAGRDGLAAKVEQLLKPRPADDGAAPSPAVTPIRPADVTPPPATIQASADELKPAPRPDIQTLKARLDEALKAKSTTPSDQAPPAAEAAIAPPTVAATVATDPTTTTEPASAPSAAPPSTRERADPRPGLTQRVRTGVARLVTRRPAAPADPSGTAVVLTPPAEEAVTTRTRTLRTERSAALAAAEAERRRPIFSLGLLLTAITAGGVLHIATAFLIPTINTGSAFDRLYFQLEANTMRVMPAMTSDANSKWPLPFLTADMRYAICRYDLSGGSVQVTATLPDIGWSLALYTPQGDNYYAVPGQDGRVVTSTFNINSASDRLLLPVPGVRRSDTDAAQVTSPQREGLVVIRAPNAGPAYQASLEDALKRASCRAAPRR